MNKVIVRADEAGSVIAQSKNNAKFGHIRVEQTRMIIDEETGFAKKKKISALIPGEIADLKGFGWDNGQEVDGKIIIKERLTPFNEKDPDRDIKIAGDTGVTCMEDDKVIYRKHFYTTDASATDRLIAHTNTEEIRAAYAAIKEKEKEEKDNATANIGAM
jgi:hypothetical protein